MSYPTVILLLALLDALLGVGCQFMLPTATFDPQHLGAQYAASAALLVPLWAFLTWLEV